MAKTNYKVLANPKYMGAYSLDDGNGSYIEIPAILKSIKQEEVIGDKGEKKMCIIGYTDQPKPFILNAGSQKIVMLATKSRYIEDWVNVNIIFYVALNQRNPGGGVIDALRIKEGVAAKAAIDYSMQSKMLEECKSLDDLRIIFESFNPAQQAATMSTKDKMKGILK